MTKFLCSLLMESTFLLDCVEDLVLKCEDAQESLVRLIFCGCLSSETNFHTNLFCVAVKLFGRLIDPHHNRKVTLEQEQTAFEYFLVYCWY